MQQSQSKNQLVFQITDQFRSYAKMYAKAIPWLFVLVNIYLFINTFYSSSLETIARFVVSLLPDYITEPVKQDEQKMGKSILASVVYFQSILTLIYYIVKTYVLKIKPKKTSHSLSRTALQTLLKCLYFIVFVGANALITYSLIDSIDPTMDDFSRLMLTVIGYSVGIMYYASAWSLYLFIDLFQKVSLHIEKLPQTPKKNTQT